MTFFMVEDRNGYAFLDTLEDTRKKAIQVFLSDKSSMGRRRFNALGYEVVTVSVTPKGAMK